MATKLNATNLAEMYREAATKYGDMPAFATRNAQKEYVPCSFKELYEHGLNLATGLIDLGIQPREHVALMADNRLEWIIADYGILIAGAADVPRGTDVTDGDIQYIIPHSDAKVVFVEHKDMLAKIEKNKSTLTNIKHIVIMDKDAQVSGGVLRMYDLMEKGRQLRAGGDRRAEERMAQIKPDDLFTMIYTSGTTGAPKGVMLMHKNMVSQVHNLPMDVDSKDRVLSILPVWHVFERIFEMITIYVGACQYYTNIRNIREDMAKVKPTFMASAPRLWENVYLGILTNVGKGSAVKRGLFKAAYFCAERVKGPLRFFKGQSLDVEGRNIFVSLATAVVSLVSFVLFLLPYLLLNVIVLSKIRAATGGKLRGSVSGGGALPLHVDLFFNNIGIPVLEGYGMTETSPILAVRTHAALVIGSVGPIFPETQLRLVDMGTGKIIFPPRSGRGKKGEIHVKGPQVMKGYYKNPEATNKVLMDGWMNTGDLGIVTYNDTLKIVGRSKETVVLMGGENVEPVPIEGKMSESPMIDQVMVVGQDMKTLTALIVPSLEYFKDKGASHEELSKNDAVYKAIREDVKTRISGESGFKAFERVTDVRLVPKAFEVGDELTNLFKLKRHLITEKYDALIKSMYQ